MTVRLVLAIIFALVALVMVCIPNITDSTGQVWKPRKMALVPAGLFLLFLLLACIRVVSPGQVGIPVTFGSAGDPVGPGVHLVNPFSTMERMSIRTEGYTMSIAAGEGNKGGDDSVSVLGSDGAQGSVDATVLFHLEKPSASSVFKELGTGYVEKLVRPTIRTCIREGFATTPMVEAATTKRGSVGTLIKDCINATLEPHGIIEEQFQLRDVHLSDEVQASIDSKVKAQQAAAQQEFELQKKIQVAEQNRVEAKGRSDAQQIIACGGTAVTNDDGVVTVIPNTGDKCQNTLSPEYLQYLYIQTLQGIVESEHNSTVILPFDENLTPLLNVPSGG